MRSIAPPATLTISRAWFPPSASRVSKNSRRRTALMYALIFGSSSTTSESMFLLPCTRPAVLCNHIAKSGLYDFMRIGARSRQPMDRSCQGKVAADEGHIVGLMKTIAVQTAQNWPLACINLRRDLEGSHDGS